MSAARRVRDAVDRAYDSFIFHEAHDALQGDVFSNYGYWRSDTRSQREASENLADELVARLGNPEGRILDVACGKGGVTRCLLKSFRPDQLVAVNISRNQLAACRRNVAEGRFARMDAVDLGFSDGTFDGIISVEAAFHFSTRTRFLREAMRVLKPGGRLVVSDQLMRRFAHDVDAFPLANYVDGPEDYESLYREFGFEEIEILDATAETWGCYWRNGLRRIFRISWRRPAFLFAYLVWIAFGLVAHTHYVIVCAKKPCTAAPRCLAPRRLPGRRASTVRFHEASGPKSRVAPGIGRE